MNAFILVVLQATAMVGSPTYTNTVYGWSVLGEFQSEKACVDASNMLVKSSASGVKAFHCLNKGSK